MDIWASEVGGRGDVRGFFLSHGDVGFNDTFRNPFYVSYCRVYQTNTTNRIFQSKPERQGESPIQSSSCVETASVCLGAVLFDSNTVLLPPASTINRRPSDSVANGFYKHVLFTPVGQTGANAHTPMYHIPTHRKVYTCNHTSYLHTGCPTQTHSGRSVR